MITSITNTLKNLLHPLAWVSTCIPIVPFELIDILDAPMPYIAGILNDHWQYYLNNSLDGITDKCVIQINQNNTLSVSHYSEEGDLYEAQSSEIRTLLGKAGMITLNECFK